MTVNEPEPIDRLYRVTFVSPDELRSWRVRVLDYAAKVGGLPVSGDESRLVVFVPLLPQGSKSVHAYVSDGARAAQIEAPVPLQQLPDGLTLIYGDRVDASAYEQREPRQAAPGNGHSGSSH